MRGCADPAAVNFLSGATGNPYPGCDHLGCECRYAGCIDPTATNFDPSATLNEVPSSCTYAVSGCKADSTAVNYGTRPCKRPQTPPKFVTSQLTPNLSSIPSSLSKLP